MPKDVIVACDFASQDAVFEFLDKFSDCERKPFVKIGMELYYACGPAIVREIKSRGHKVFLDLKLHDIPNTVRKAMSVLRDLDVDITNVHAAGTTAMMRAGLEGLTGGGAYGIAAEAEQKDATTHPLLIAVTQLTSTDEVTMHRDLLIDKPLSEVVMHYAKKAAEAGLNGVVCSPLEAADVHKTCGENFLTICPGIRFAEGEVGDQKRVMTPAEAANQGCDYIVMGRPITQAKDPVEAYNRACREFLGE